MDVEEELPEAVETRPCAYCGEMVYKDRAGDWRHVYPKER